MKVTTLLQPKLTAEPNPLLPEPTELTTDPLAGAGGYRVQTDLQVGESNCRMTAKGVQCGNEGR